MSALVKLKRIGARIGDTLILRDLDLTVANGESVGLVGANGSGKTTLLRLFATLLTPSSGKGRVIGASLTSPEPVGVRSRIGLIGHTPGLFPRLSLEENTAFVARLVGAPAQLF